MNSRIGKAFPVMMRLSIENMGRSSRAADKLMKGWSWQAERLDRGERKAEVRR
jgi:hypothetical protein